MDNPEVPQADPSQFVEETMLLDALSRLAVADPAEVPVDSPARAGVSRVPPPVLYLSFVPEEGFPGVPLERLFAAQEELLIRGGYDPGARQFGWLLDQGIAHEVLATDTLGVWIELEPNIRMGLPGGDLPRCRYVAALFGRAFDQAAVAVWLPGSGAHVWRGFELRKAEGLPFDAEEAQDLWRALAWSRNVEFHLSHDRGAVEMWDYERRTGRDLRSWVSRIVAGLREAGLDPIRLKARTADSFLVWRDEYTRFLLPNDAFGSPSPSDCEGYQALIQAHQEIVARLRALTDDNSPEAHSQTEALGS